MIRLPNIVRRAVYRQLSGDRRYAYRLCAACAAASAVLAFALIPAGCSTDTDDPSFSNPFDPIAGSGLPVPDSVIVMVGDNSVRLSWSLPEEDTVDEYAIFRRRVDPVDDDRERLLDRVNIPSFTDRRVRNGITYVYRIAAGAGGRFGHRTDEIEATPGLFTFRLAGGKEVTRDRSVSIDFTLPSAQAIRLSEDPADFSLPWQSTAGSVTWRLSRGDGEKTVYARFRLSDGSETLPVYDTIRLDTNASILDFGFDGSEVRRPGDAIHFRLDAGEPNGTATVTVQGVFDRVPLFDDGTNGDAVAGDGIYERTISIPIAAAVNNTEVRAFFTDEAGNVATEATAPRLLTVRRAPDPVDLLPPIAAEPPDAPSVKLRWGLSHESVFSAYRVFRSEAAPVDSSDLLVRTVTDRNTLQHEDTDIVEGRTYHYRIYVKNSFGQESGSAPVQIAVPNLRPPAAVRVDSPVATTTSRIALQWSRCEDRDFAAYRIYRNKTGAVTENDFPVAEIASADRTSWDDSDLQESTTYYYRVFTVDTGGLVSRSNEVSATTRNAAPEAVTLHEPTAVSANRIALQWSASTEPDFRDYRIYRNMSGAVSESDSLVVTITDISLTYYDDSGRRENTKYYYRVYTTDQNGLFSRSNEVMARTRNEPPPVVVLNAATAVDSTAATLSWSQSTVHDFAYYRLYRDEIGTVTTSSRLVVEMDDRTFTSFRDTGLTSGKRYYYRVFVVDDGDDALATGSNTISIVTN